MIYNYSYYNIILKESQDFVYIYNSFSGALCKLEKDIYDLILKNEINDNVKCKYFDELYNQGFIKPKDLNEFNKIFLTERINILSSNNNKLSIIITPTLACNLNCEYCFEKDNRRNIAADDKTIIDIADFILKQLTLNIKEVHITWFGGEPLLAYNKIKLFNTYFKEKILCLNIKYSATQFFNQLEFDKKKIEFNKYLSNLLDRPYRKRVVKYRPTFCGLYKLKNFVVGPTGELYKCEHHVGQ